MCSEGGDRETLVRIQTCEVFFCLSEQPWNLHVQRGTGYEDGRGRLSSHFVSHPTPAKLNKAHKPDGLSAVRVDHAENRLAPLNSVHAQKVRSAHTRSQHQPSTAAVAASYRMPGDVTEAAASCERRGDPRSTAGLPRAP
jgi:hypothetical protein